MCPKLPPCYRYPSLHTLLPYYHPVATCGQTPLEDNHEKNKINFSVYFKSFLSKLIAKTSSRVERGVIILCHIIPNIQIPQWLQRNYAKNYNSLSYVKIVLGYHDKNFWEKACRQKKKCRQNLSGKLYFTDPSEG